MIATKNLKSSRNIGSGGTGSGTDRLLGLNFRPDPHHNQILLSSECHGAVKVKLVQTCGEETWCFSKIRYEVFKVKNKGRCGISCSKSMKSSRAVNLLESLKRRKCNTEKYNYQQRLLGVARLLSQMVEPMVKAAIEISSLPARSFFMGFSVTILAILGRLWVLVQQVVREYYPSNDEIVTLECVWDKDKFVLLEKVNKFEIKKRETGLQSSNIKYQTVEAFLGLGGTVVLYVCLCSSSILWYLFAREINLINICGHGAGGFAEQPMNISVNAKVELHESTIDEGSESNEN
ncbi:hypothetical protein C5167_000198 [Papaver somniferum]|uniref:Uncharacterized protein n=1 Tax=Papaver somniferum TaxID=3469 RepID=A0A4Y7KV19_PAPSO|nr:hypothetical protein C5167_000198 [Papaver somniferum]